MIAPIVGALAAVLSVTSFVPQAWHVIRTRRTEQLVTPMWLINVVGFGLWITYGLLLGAWAIVAPNVICWTLSAFILVMKLVPPRTRHAIADVLDPAVDAAAAHPAPSGDEPAQGQPHDPPPRLARDAHTTSNMRRYAAVLLDLDGTLVDSNDAHAHAWVETLNKHGIEVPFERVRGLIGMGGDRVIEELTGWPRDSRKARELQDQHTAIFLDRWLHDVRPIDQAREFVLRLREEGYQVVLASAAHEDVLRPLLEIAGIADLLDGNARPPKPEESKPDPEAIEVALSRVDVDRSRVVMIGDTPYDIEAARAAHVDVLGFTTGGYSPEELAGAIAVYRGPSDLLAHWTESPLGDGEAR